MEASDHLHAPAAIQQGERPPVSIEWETRWVPLPIWTSWKRKKIITRAGNRTLYCTAKSLYALRYPRLYRTSELWSLGWYVNRVRPTACLVSYCAYVWTRVTYSETVDSACKYPRLVKIRHDGFIMKSFSDRTRGTYCS